MSRAQTMRTVRAVGRGIVAATVGLLALAVIVVGSYALAGYRPVVIQTGSMGETAPPGSLVIARPVAEVELGDVLIMRTEGRATITHRVVDLESRPTGLVAVTRGDANPDIDPEPYALSDSELTARWVVPDAGRWLLQIRNPAIGLVLLIGVVGTISFFVLRRIWAPANAAALPTDPTAFTMPVPPPPGPRDHRRERRRAPENRDRRRRALIVATAAGAAFVVGGAAYSLYLGVDTVGANSFATRPCFDSRLGSIQSGQHVNDTAGTTSVAITAVDPSKSFLLVSASSASNEPDESMVTAHLASSTSIEFVRNSNDAPPADIVVEWAVVEYDCGVSVQRGIAASSGAPVIDVPITTVDAASSFAVLSQGAESAAGTFGPGDTATVELTSSTNLRIEPGAIADPTVPFAWQVVTFDGGDISTQQLAASFAPTDTVVNVTIPTTVDPESTAVFVSARFNGSGADIGDRMVRARLVDGDTVELTRSVASDLVDVSIQVVEFADGTTVRHGVIDLAPAESLGAVTIPPVQPSRSTVTSSVMVAGGSSGGSTSHTTDDVVGEASGRFTLADERTVEVRRDSTASDASFAWQVITWNGPNWVDLDAPYRQRIDVAGGAVVTPTGYSTPLTFDHAQLVTDGLSLADGSDLRVWRHDGLNWIELHRVLDDDSAWNDPSTTFWFRTQEAIAADDTATYWLYFGDDTPAAPLDDPTQVWLTSEGFDDGTLGAFEDRTGGTAWYDDDPWSADIAITIDGSGLAASVSDVPVLVSVTDPTITTLAQPDASDIRFTLDGDPAVLPHAIEEWDAASDTLTAWVRVPSVTAGADTTLRMYYGSATAADQSDARSTFAGSIATWLLATDPLADRPSLDDDGPAQRDGIALADAIATATPAGPGIDLDGTLDRLESQPFVIPDASFTLATSFRADTLAADAVLLAQGDPAGGGIVDVTLDSTTGEVSARLATATADGVVTVAGGVVTPGAWQHVALTWDRATLVLYVDGVQVDAQATTGGIARPGPIPVVIGARSSGADAVDGIVRHVEIDGGAWSLARVQLHADGFSGVRLGSSASASGSFFDQGAWSARWPVVVDADSVAGTLTDFPLLVQFAEPAIGAEALADGADLVFTADDGVTRLDHWVERWNAGTGELTAWVRVPTLDGANDTTLYLYAGNPTADDHQDPAAVWGPDVDLVVTGTP